jgi:hypothetical protein
LNDFSAIHRKNNRRSFDSTRRKCAPRSAQDDS